MKRLITLIGCAMLLLNLPVLGYDVNKDITNQGPDAHDVAVELSGTETVWDHFDGFHFSPPVGWFNSFASGPSGPNTLLHWQNFDDGTDNVINNGQEIHIGWSTQDHASNVKDMYWTDATGQRLPGSKVYNSTTKWTYEQSSQVMHAAWDNIFSPDGGPGETITVSDVVYAVLDVAIDLDSLNHQNAFLSGLFAPLPGGASFEVPPGGTVTLDIPAPVLPGHVVVARYEVTAPGSDAIVIDFVQSNPAGSVIPTLTEWGLIIFALLVMGCMAWVFVRRRKMAAVSI